MQKSKQWKAEQKRGSEVQNVKVSHNSDTNFGNVRTKQAPVPSLRVVQPTELRLLILKAKCCSTGQSRHVTTSLKCLKSVRPITVHRKLFRKLWMWGMGVPYCHYQPFQHWISETHYIWSTLHTGWQFVLMKSEYFMSFIFLLFLCIDCSIENSSGNKGTFSG